MRWYRLQPFSLLLKMTTQPPTLKTEDTGKMFEMGLCMAMGIPYDGPYKYSLDLPTKLQPRLKKLCTEFFPKPYKHTAKKGARYDYTSEDGGDHISAKSIKKGGGKVAPQVIGQAQPQKFCEEIGIPYTSVPDLKRYIQEHITEILPHLVSHTFDCPNIYFNEEKNTIHYIRLIESIAWTTFEYEWTCGYETWNNSSTLKLKTPAGSIALVEFQFHSASRTNMAVRWCYENFLTLFKDHLFIVEV
jgi:hypothetical protein